MHLMRTGKLYGNKPCNCFSLERFSDEYETFSEKFNRYWKGYKIDSNGLIRADTAPTVDYDMIISLYLSKDLSLLEKHKEIFEKPSKYLDGKKSLNEKGNNITYLTFPRMGSTFLRKYIFHI